MDKKALKKGQTWRGKGETGPRAGLDVHWGRN